MAVSIPQSRKISHPWPASTSAARYPPDRGRGRGRAGRNEPLLSDREAAPGQVGDTRDASSLQKAAAWEEADGLLGWTILVLSGMLRRRRRLAVRLAAS